MRLHLLTILSIALIAAPAQAVVLSFPQAEGRELNATRTTSDQEPGRTMSEVALASPGPHQANHWVVYDNKGIKVGEVKWYTFGTAFTSVRIGDTPVTLAVQQKYITGAQRVTSVLWESGDCSGTPFMRALGTELQRKPLVSVSGPGWTTYTADTAQQRTITARSQWVDPPHGSLPHGYCKPIDKTLKAFPASALTDLSTQFSAPFSVQ